MIHIVSEGDILSGRFTSTDGSGREDLKSWALVDDTITIRSIGEGRSRRRRACRVWDEKLGSGLVNGRGITIEGKLV